MGIFPLLSEPFWSSTVNTAVPLTTTCWALQTEIQIDVSILKLQMFIYEWLQRSNREVTSSVCSWTLYSRKKAKNVKADWSNLKCKRPSTQKHAGALCHLLHFVNIFTSVHPSSTLYKLWYSGVFTLQQQKKVFQKTEGRLTWVWNFWCGS